MVFETLAADVLEQLLQIRNLADASAAKGLQRIVGKGAVAGIAANDAVAIIGGIARVSADFLSPRGAFSR
jgi:hypothetical protein